MGRCCEGLGWLVCRPAVCAGKDGSGGNQNVGYPEEMTEFCHLQLSPYNGNPPEPVVHIGFAERPAQIETANQPVWQRWSALLPKFRSSKARRRS